MNVGAGNNFCKAKQIKYGKNGRCLTRSLVGLTDNGQNTSIPRISAKLVLRPRGIAYIHKLHTMSIVLAH
jgi:hypothetical protein